MAKVLTTADFGIEGKSDDTPELVTGGPEDAIETKEEKPAVKKVEPGKKEPKKEEPVSFKPKYATHEEAEKVEKEAAKKMHKATEEASRLRKMLLDQNLKNGSDSQTVSEEEKIADAALAEISKLDPETDKEYNSKCARIWAKANRQIAKLEFSEQSQVRDTKSAANKDLEEKVDDALEEAGYSSEWDKKAFAVMANYIPTNITDQDDQIEWVIGQIGEYRKTILGEGQKKSEEEKTGRKDLKVLGQGSTKKGSEKEEEVEHKPETLGEQLKRNKERKRLSNKI